MKFGRGDATRPDFRTPGTALGILRLLSSRLVVLGVLDALNGSLAAGTSWLVVLGPVGGWLLD
jgi:hypothetical protein